MRTKNNGFTLLELLVTLVVVAITVGLAAPSFNAQLQNNRALTLGDEMASALNYARIEAVKQARRITVCASKDGATCEGNWNEGFIVFVDAAGADDAAPDPSAGVLKVWRESKHKATLTAKFSDDTEASYIRFTPLGAFARPSSGATKAEIDIELKGCSGKNVPVVTVNVTGLVSTSRKECP